MIRVTIYNEFYHEQHKEAVKAIYPNGMHAVLKDMLEKNDDITVRVVTLDMPECGLTEEVLNDTDVLMWWGHVKHNDVPDEVADRVVAHIQKGMGFIAMHSGHHSKPFKRVLGTTGNLRWRDQGGKTRIWCVAPSHPIAKGVPEMFELEAEEMYGEMFDIPKPDDVIFISWYQTGNVFRGGCTFTRGLGRIFYFHPGHETYRSFYNENVQKVLTNAVYWTANECAPHIGIDCVNQKESYEDFE